MKLEFTKMHGAGNDFVLLDEMGGETLPLHPDVIRKICDRRFGVGCDQLLVVAPSKKGDFRMDIYNADGGKVEMCGNGIRCLAKYVRDKGYAKKTGLEVETLAGIIRPAVIKDHPKTSGDTVWVRVDMGEPELGGQLTLNANRGPKIGNQGSNSKRSTIHNPRFTIFRVSMGNPHCVIFVEDVDKYPVTEYGPVIENDPHFPNRTNVEFVQVLDKKNIKMRVWERGAGETLACGTGACGAAVAAVVNHKTDRSLTAHLKGGDLEIVWDEKTNHVLMTGPATTVFEGEMEI